MSHVIQHVIEILKMADRHVNKMGKVIILLALIFTLAYGEDIQQCDKMPKRKIDTAYLTIELENTINLQTNLTLKGVTKECYTCELQKMAILNSSVKNCTVLVDTRWPFQVELSSASQKLQDCSKGKLSQHFREGGNYTLYVKMGGVNGSQLTCNMVLRNSPMDTFIPIYVAMGVLVALVFIWWGLKKLHSAPFMYRLRNKLNGSENDGFLDHVDKKHPKLETHVDSAAQGKSKKQNVRRRKGPKSSSSDSSKSTYTAQDLGLPTSTVENEPPRPTRERLKSLDTFRGISIIIMIFVNYRGGDYWFFRHSKWNGLTVADLVFPWFVWIMGTAMVYSFQSQLRRATPKKKIFWKIFKRSVILFALGLLINSSDGLNPGRLRSFRIPGVLQRFAGTYLIVATFHMFFARPNDPHQYNWWSGVRDVVDYWGEWILNMLLVIVWLVLTFVIHDPKCPSGYLGPGGLANDHDGANVTLCTGGAASYIDRMVFGEAHIYNHPTCKEIYKSVVAHDPEGLLGTLTSCFMCFLGLQAGKILLLFPDWKARVKRFLFWGVVLGILALILCRGWKDGGFIPINKNLWSLSFVLCMSSFAFFLFSFCYVTIDVYKVWSGAPFYYPGMNSIFFYVGHLVFLPYFPVSLYVDQTSHWERLFMNLWGPAFWCMNAILLYMGHEMINQPLRRFWGVEPNSHMVYLPINIGDTAVWILLSYFLFYHKIFISV